MLGATILTLGALSVSVGVHQGNTERAGALAFSPSLRIGAAGSRLGHMNRVDAMGTPLPPSGSEGLPWILLGLVLTATGAAIGFVGVSRVLGEEAFLALRTDGVHFHLTDDATFLAWDEVSDIVVSGGALHFERHEGEPHVCEARFAGTELEAVARSARDVRRRALFGLLR